MNQDAYLTAEARQRLKYVKVGDGTVSLRDFPDFLLLGPQRTGTSWVYHKMRFHPEILWSQEKEIFFFSQLKGPANPMFRSAELSWYLAHFRDDFALKLAKNLASLRATGHLYRPLIRGEATASYAVMDTDLIDEVVTLNPDIRAILMIRNPIERAWSHAKKDLVRDPKRPYEEVDASEFRDFFSSDYMRRCARYVDNYDDWSARLKPDHLFVGRFDDIKARPTEFLADICRFLGVRSDRKVLGRHLDRPVNPTSVDPVPEEHRRFLEELHAEDIEKLKQRFNLSWDRPSPQ